MPDWLLALLTGGVPLAAVGLTWRQWRVELRARDQANTALASAALVDNLQEQLAAERDQREKDLRHYQELIEVERHEVRRLQKQLHDLRRDED